MEPTPNGEVRELERLALQLERATMRAWERYDDSSTMLAWVYASKLLCAIPQDLPDGCSSSCPHRLRDTSPWK